MSRLRWILLSNSNLEGNIITYTATSQLSIYTMAEDEQDLPEGYDLVFDVYTFDGAKLVSHETSPFGNLTGGTLTFDRNLKKIGGNAFLSATKLKTINLPKTITEIGSNAFAGCSNLWQISLPDNLISIGSYALSRCKLDSLFLPKRVSSIGDGLISNTPVTQLAIDSENTEYYSDKKNGEIIQTSTKSLVLGCSESDIPVDGSVTSIAANAFIGCSRLSYIDIPDTIKSIGTNAFSYCTFLKSIVLPSSVIAIGEYAFSGCSSLRNFNSLALISSISSNMFRSCTSLQTIELPPTLRQIANRAFYNCTSLNNVVIPPQVMIIEPQAFYGCRSLTTMTVQATTPPNLPNSNAISSATRTIYVPSDSYEAYRTASGWSSFASYLQRM